ncbi:unnamed protein product [Linum trigynum]
MMGQSGQAHMTHQFLPYMGLTQSQVGLNEGGNNSFFLQQNQEGGPSYSHRPISNKIVSEANNNSKEVDINQVIVQLGETGLKTMEHPCFPQKKKRNQGKELDFEGPYFSHGGIPAPTQSPKSRAIIRKSKTKPTGKMEKESQPEKQQVWAEDKKISEV